MNGKLRAFLLLVAFLAAGFSQSSIASADSAAGSEVRTAHPVNGVTVVDRRHLVVDAGCPSDEPAIKVVESDKVVRVRAMYTATRRLCLRLVRVTLKSPLRDRKILDAVTSREVRRVPLDVLPPPMTTTP